ALRRPALWLFGAVVLIPSILWYWHAADIANRFYPHHFFGEGGVRVMPWRWYDEILRRTFSLGLTIVPCALTLAGLFLAGKKGRSALFYWWLTAMILFVLVVGYGNRHPWYQLSFVPIAAVFAGSAMARFCSRLDRWPSLTGVAGLIV